MVCPLLVEDLSNAGQMVIEVSILEQFPTYKFAPAHLILIAKLKHFNILDLDGV